MKYRPTHGLIIVSLSLLFAVLPARADCPDDLCDCIGEAGEFSMVGSQAKIRHGVISYSGYGYPVSTYVETSMCAIVGKVGGKFGGETEIEEDAIFSATEGVAVKLSAAKSYGYTYPGSFIGGDVATGGGSVKGETFADIGGVVDTTGAHPSVPDCGQALTDAVAGSVMLAALPATQSLGDVVINDGSSFDINVGSGIVSVIEIDQLIVKPLKYYGYASPSTVNINLNGTNSVVINVTEKLAIGSSCEILVNGGDIEDVIINVVGPGSTVRIARDAIVAAPILAPERKIVASANSFSSNLFAGKLIVKGGNISETMFCP